MSLRYREGVSIGPGLEVDGGGATAAPRATEGLGSLHMSMDLMTA